MPATKCTHEENASIGDTIYRQRMQCKVEPKYNGNFLVIDIETGADEIDADYVLATKRLLAGNPDAVVYGLRIGSPTAYRIGGRFVVDQQ